MKNKSPKRNILLELASIILIPISIYWVLMRKGIYGLLDILALGVVFGFTALWAVRWIAKQKIITFAK